jgi:predicted transcriptional regulator
MNRLSGAPVVMHKKGRSTDAVVLEEIIKKPGIAIAEIAENLEWTNGKIDGSVNRLVA